MLMQHAVNVQGTEAEGDGFIVRGGSFTITLKKPVEQSDVLVARKITFSRGDTLSAQALAAASSSKSIRSQLTSAHLTLVCIPARHLVAKPPSFPAALYHQIEVQFLRKLLETINAFRGLSEAELDCLIKAG